MTISEFLTNVSYALRGIDDDPPTFGDDESDYWISTLNRKKRELYNNTKLRWNNTYDVRSVSTIVASATPSFTLDDSYPTYDDNSDFLAFSGDNSVKAESRTAAYIIKTNGNRYDLPGCHAEDRDLNYRQVFIAGQNPQTLYFTDEIKASEDIIGGVLYIMGYFMPADVSLEADVLPFIDPDWAVMAVASEIAFNDIVYEEKAPDLNAKANNLLTQMIEKNRKGTFGRPRVTPTSVNPITSSDRSR